MYLLECFSIFLFMEKMQTQAERGNLHKVHQELKQQLILEK